MALFTIQTFKHLGSQKWTNRYIVDAADLAAATSAALIILDHERTRQLDVVTLDYARISTAATGDDVYTTLPYNLNGSASTGGVDYLPLYNTVLVDIGVTGGGRPSRKFYRPPIRENEQSNGTLDSSVVAAFNTMVSDMISDLEDNSTPAVDPQGQALQGASVSTHPAVQERQLHRRRRRTP